MGKQLLEIDQIDEVDFIEFIIQEHIDHEFMEDPIWNMCMIKIFCVILLKLVKKSFYIIFDYIYFWVSFKVNDPDLSMAMFFK